MTFTRRQRIVLLLAGVAIGASLLAFAALPAGQGDHTEDVVFHAPDGPAINVTGPTNVSLVGLFPDANTVSINSTDGNVTFASQGRTNVTVTQLTGTTTVLSSLDVAARNLTVTPEDKPFATIGGGATAFEWRDPVLDDSTVDFTYTASGSPATLTLGGLPATQMVVAVNDTSGSVIDAGSANSFGQLTLTSLDTGTHDVVLQTAAAPVLSNPSPTGGLQAEPSQLSVDVNDSDFPGDSVTVEFVLDGSSVGTDTLTSNGTATASISPPDAGQHVWNATATDDAGSRTTLPEQTFSVPDELEIRNESAPNQLIDANVTLAFFGENVIVTRNSTDGTLNMTGLPPGEFYLRADAPGYHSRTTFVDSLYIQQEVFLLNESVATIEARFVLEDVSGQFDETSTLYIKRPLEINGTTEYRTIIADQFGTEGVPATLEEDVRYRLSVVADDGATQDLGPYRAQTSETVTVVPGSPAVDIPEGEDGWGSAAFLDNDIITVIYDDPEQATDRLEVRIVEQGDRDNQLAPTRTYTDLGNVTLTETLTANQTEDNWVVILEITRGGETFTTEHVVGATTDAGFPSLDPKWRQFFGVIVLLMFGGTFSMLNRAAGAIATGLFGGLLWVLGILQGVTAAGAILLYLFIAILYAAYASGRP